jgi:hypothetical protein
MKTILRAFANYLLVLCLVAAGCQSKISETVSQAARLKTPAAIQLQDGPSPAATKQTEPSKPAPSPAEARAAAPQKPETPRAKVARTEDQLTAKNAEVPSEDSPPEPEKPLPDDPPTASAKRLSKNVFFEKLPNDQRRVYVSTFVCLREGNFGLECFLCRRGTKEHESILATQADARAIHAGLKVAGLEPGKPVEFEPKFKPPTGDRVKVSVQYKDSQGKLMVEPAQHWIRDLKTKKALEEQWVFAGSILVPGFDPKDPPLYAAAEDGAMICVTNVPTAMLDLPIISSKHLEDRSFAPFTERIPPLGTPVFVVLEPFPKAKVK